MFTLAKSAGIRFGENRGAGPANRRKNIETVQISGMKFFSGAGRRFWRPARPAPAVGAGQCPQELGLVTPSVRCAPPRRRAASRPLLFLLCGGLLSLAHSCLAQSSFTEWGIPTGGSWPETIILGPDGACWFAEFLGGRIGRVTTNGVISEFGIPTPNSDPFGVASGPDGNIWFTETYSKRIGRTGTNVYNPGILDWPVNTNTAPAGIITGFDNNLWFAEFDAGKIGVITTNGQIIHEYGPLETNCLPYNLTKGPDGNLWFTENGSGRIGAITPGGAVAEFPLVTNCYPFDIVTGPDGALWFTENNTNKIGRLTINAFSASSFSTNFNGVPATNSYSASALTEFLIPTNGIPGITNFPYGIAVGSDSNIWFTDYGTGTIDRLAPDGSNLTQFYPPTANSYPTRLTTGLDGNIWFCEFNANQIGRLVLPGLLSLKVPGITLSNGLAFNGLLATFQDSYPTNTTLTTNSFSVTINWGDNTTDVLPANSASSVIQIITNAGGGFEVLASHTSTNAGSYPATVSVIDTTGNISTSFITVAVLPPMLQIEPMGVEVAGSGARQIILSWPASFPGFRVETSSLPTANWTVPPLAPALVNDRYVVTNTVTTSTYYRLKK